MADEIKNVVIVGAGGNLGPSILNAFLTSSPFNVTVLSREGSTSAIPEGVKVVRANFDSVESLTSALQGQDAVVSLVGGPALGNENKIIDAAIAAGVKRYLPSEYGSDTRNEQLLAIVPIFKGKISTVEYLKSKQDSISWSSIITGPFFDWGVKVGFLGQNIASKTATFVDGGDNLFTTTNLHQIGLAIIATLKNASLTKNQYIYVSSFTTTQKEILAAIEKLSGDKYTVEQVSSDDLIADGSEKLGKGDFSGIGSLIQAGAFGKKGYGNHSPRGYWNEKLGLQKEDFDETIKTVLAGKLVGQK